MDKIGQLAEQLKTHQLNDSMEFGKAEERDVKLIKEITDIKENHLAHLQLYYEKMSIDLTWMKWLIMGICGGIGALAIAYLTK